MSPVSRKTHLRLADAFHRSRLIRFSDVSAIRLSMIDRHEALSRPFSSNRRS
jgi:hypothetical protein